MRIFQVDVDPFFYLTGMNTLVGYDLVPEPKIIDAALRACRRLNDFASAVRILEVVKVSEITMLKLFLDMGGLLLGISVSSVFESVKNP